MKNSNPEYAIALKFFRESFVVTMVIPCSNLNYLGWSNDLDTK